ncbi:non-hydrolyzing UDP-N-acetylglucosamine 2-epimerase [Streptomyces sp. BE230]|uniref:non-hydrolyzing UDP-N-acetylglucosamine 2-epimerase n=1 Tax=Streptomyces sp. BE230 TaxID=3002526 RepID=UPI002ED597C2|nr:UDP-N-acetylglucosamine 2-epimerase (non-hydrolyzing) [Streptomyces sp. BE230]
MYSALPTRSVAVVLGTRPELVKLAPVIHRLGPAARLIHTGQHWDEAMSGQFLDELGLPEPELLSSVGGTSRAVQIGRSLEQLDALFAADRPSAVVVQGDTNATLAGALAANARGIPLVHVEAGLRSHDPAMPEEHNRILVDAVSDVLCAATAENRANLLAEGVDAERIAMTGNTVVEAVRSHLPHAEERDALLARHGLSPDRYVLATVHRPENTDDTATLRTVLTELSGLADEGVPVLLPLHPRTRGRIEAERLGHLLDGIRVLEPLGYGDFLALARHAALLISDSGGIQEECTVLGRPLIVVRRSTERPESMAHFAHLVNPGPEIGRLARLRLAEGDLGLRRLERLPSPYGDGHAADRIAALVAALPEMAAAAEPALAA